jgi:hypothetical protein
VCVDVFECDVDRVHVPSWIRFTKLYAGDSHGLVVEHYSVGHGVGDGHDYEYYLLLQRGSDKLGRNCLGYPAVLYDNISR